MIMTKTTDKPIVSADYDFGDTFDSEGHPLDVTCKVKYVDGSIGVFSEPKDLVRIQKRIHAQQKAIAERFIETKFYLHGSKESNYDQSEEWGLSEDARRTFCYTGYEVGFTIQVDRRTGKAMATHVNDVALTEAVEI